jgi:hypothetical protein
VIRILEVDGGGIKGMIPITVLKEIERVVGKPIYEIFDLMVGTSVGAIICGVLASGKTSACRLNDFMLKVIPEMFHWRMRVPFVQPKYSRKAFINYFSDEVGIDFQMSSCVTKFMCTSVSKVDGRTHFFKGWEKKDGKLKLIDAIHRSYAAPIFFGHIVDKEAGQVWLDGGTGNENCPLGETLTEAVRQNWLQKAVKGTDEVHILSLGTGHSFQGMPFGKAKRGGNVGDGIFFLDPTDGGIGRAMSLTSRVKLAYDIAKFVPNYSFNRVDCLLNKKIDKLNGLKYMKDYQSLGEAISCQVEYENLK